MDDRLRVGSVLPVGHGGESATARHGIKLLLHLLLHVGVEDHVENCPVEGGAGGLAARDEEIHQAGQQLGPPVWTLEGGLLGEGAPLLDLLQVVVGKVPEGVFLRQGI